MFSPSKTKGCVSFPVHGNTSRPSYKPGSHPYFLLPHWPHVLFITPHVWYMRGSAASPSFTALMPAEASGLWHAIVGLVLLRGPLTRHAHPVAVILPYLMASLFLAQFRSTHQKSLKEDYPILVHSFISSV